MPVSNMRATGALKKETVTLANFLDKADLVVSRAEEIKALDGQVGWRLGDGWRLTVVKLC
jgi:hypothetical protein